MAYPPVLVPPIKLKYSHGRGVSASPHRALISSMSFCSINSVEIPRMPPPSANLSYGHCCAQEPVSSLPKHSIRLLTLGGARFDSPCELVSGFAPRHTDIWLDVPASPVGFGRLVVGLLSDQYLDILVGVGHTLGLEDLRYGEQAGWFHPRG